MQSLDCMTYIDQYMPKFKAIPYDLDKVVEELTAEAAEIAARYNIKSTDNKYPEIVWDIVLGDR